MTIATAPTRTGPPRRRIVDPVTRYAEDVVAGRIVTGGLVRLQCERHLRDLETGAARGVHFDAEAAQKAIDFFPLLKHSKGEWAGQPFRLQPWQEFIVGSLFGWQWADGTRRFRLAYIEVARKNGKTTLMAGLGLLLGFFDDEPGAEVYAAATKRDQARLVWGEASRMVKKTGALYKRIRVVDSAANLNMPETASKFEALGADQDTSDGLNTHAAIIDELHAHKTRDLWDVLETSTASRRQPLTIAITTAGWNRQSICWEQHDYGIKVVENIIPNDEVFVYIATVDEGDDWRDRNVWIKANPNLGVSAKLSIIEGDCRKAEEVPGRQNAFKRLHLDIWTEQADRWLDMAVWDENGVERINPIALEGQRCFAGLDLSTTKDLTALGLWLPDEKEGGGDALMYFWIPEEGMHRRTREDRVPYELWVREGWIEATPGNVVDYDIIRERIKELRQLYNIEELAIDRWNSTQLQTQLMGDGLTVVPFGQGFAFMTAPTKEIERLVLDRKLRHGGNPVLRWNASNVAVAQDAAGNLKIDKAKSTERVDGMTALAMAIGRAMVHQDDAGSGGEIRVW